MNPYGRNGSILALLMAAALSEPFLEEPIRRAAPMKGRKGSGGKRKGKPGKKGAGVSR